MKSLLSLIALTLTVAFAFPSFSLACGPAHPDYLARTELKISEGQSIEDAIVRFFVSQNRVRCVNAINTKFSAAKKEMEGQGTLSYPVESSLFQIMNGKSGGLARAMTYLMGIPVQMDGTGMIETYNYYVLVDVTYTPSEDDETQATLEITFRKYLEDFNGF